jgi:hypothetical protein
VCELSSARKGDEMSNVVTSPSAAISQFGLFAPRQQVFVVERLGSAPDDATALQSSRDALHQPTQSALETRRDEAIASVQRDGPSRARIEVRSLDMGLTPAEVVGTPDVLQRFDENGNGHVDLTEADKATLARQKGGTFAGVGGTTGANEPKKIIVTTTPDGSVQQVGGDSSGSTVEVPKRLYGQGAEIAVGPTVTQGAPAHTTAHGPADPKAPIVQDGTGEVKLYDKVASTDPAQDDPTQDSQPDGALYQKALALAAALGGKKTTTVVEVSAYSQTAAITAKPGKAPKAVTA